jgi:type II secretory pathway pseudopilin PulG
MTLLEITIVLVIISLIMAFTLPKFGPMRTRGQLRTSARNVAALIRYARAEAIYGHRTVKVRLDLAKQRYWLDKMTDSIPAIERDKGKLEMIEAMHNLPEEVGFERVILYEGAEKPHDDVVALDFNPRGNVTAATIVLADRRGKRMTVDIFGTTGAVEVYAGGPPTSDEK